MSRMTHPIPYWVLLIGMFCASKLTQAQEGSDPQWLPREANDLRDRTCDSTRFPKSKRSGINVNSPCFYPDEHFKPLDLQGKNWRGVGTLLDAIAGDPKFRQRTLTYCLIPNKGRRILCEHTQVRYLNHPHGDLFSEIMKMLTSIQFVDPLSSQSSFDPNAK